MTYLGYNQNLLRDRKNLKNRFRDSLIKIKSNKITKVFIINTNLMVKINKMNEPYLNENIVSIIEEVFPVYEFNYNIIIHPINKTYKELIFWFMKLGIFRENEKYKTRDINYMAYIIINTSKKKNFIYSILKEYNPKRLFIVKFIYLGLIFSIVIYLIYYITKFLSS